MVRAHAADMLGGSSLKRQVPDRPCARTRCRAIRKPAGTLLERRAQDRFDGQALRFGDTLDQKDQAVQIRCQCPNAIAKLSGAIFKPSHSGFKRSHSVDQIAFESDHPAIQTGNIVLQAVQSPSDGL